MFPPVHGWYIATRGARRGSGFLVPGSAFGFWVLGFWVLGFWVLGFSVAVAVRPNCFAICSIVDRCVPVTATCDGPSNSTRAPALSRRLIASAVSGPL